MNAEIREKIFNHYGIIKGREYVRFPRVKKKKNSVKKVRWIYAPSDKLKALQRTILCKILYQYASHPCSHGYVAYRNIRSGAHEHCKKAYTIVLDLKSFFPSITKEMVKDALSFYVRDFSEKQNKDFFIWDKQVERLLEEVQTQDKTITLIDVLSELCTYEGVLPQGAPTSGALSNIVMYPLDCLFEQVAVSHDLVYTRYADDLSFSGDDLDSLKKTVFGYIFRKIKDFSFEVNKKKVHVFQGNQRLITGLNIHENGVRPARQYRRKLRARLANIRNRVTKCTSFVELEGFLKERFFLKSEMGHYWYVLYADTYTTTGVEKMAYDYLIPILYKIEEFIPEAIVGGEQFLYNLSKACSRGCSNLLLALVAELRKVAVTSCATLKSPKTGRYKYYGSEKNPFSLIFDVERLTNREKREVLHRALSHESRPKMSLWLSGITARQFLILYRLANPGDQFNLLTCVIDKGEARRSFWYKLCLLGAKCNYSQRLELIRKISNSKLFQTHCCTEVYPLQKAIRKIMRGITSLDLIEFVTSENEIIRLAAQDLLYYKNRETNNNKVI